MHITECQNEKAPLSFVAFASLNPKAHLLQRSLSLATCFFPIAQSLQVSTWAPFMCPPFGPLGSPLSHNVVLQGSDFYFKSESCPLSPTFLFLNNYRRQKLSKIEYSNQPWLIRNITQLQQSSSNGPPSDLLLLSASSNSTIPSSNSHVSLVMAVCAGPGNCKFDCWDAGYKLARKADPLLLSQSSNSPDKCLITNTYKLPLRILQRVRNMHSLLSLNGSAVTRSRNS